MAVVTLNPADKNASITLSGGDLIATDTAGGGAHAARCTLFRAFGAGKFYYEATIDVLGAGTAYMTFGYGTAAASLTANVGGTASMGVRAHDGLSARQGVDFQYTTLGALPAGAVIGVGINLLTKEVQYWENGVVNTTVLSALTLTDPITPMVGTYNLNDQMTLNFGATPFYALPAGYAAWNQEYQQTNIRRPVMSQRPVHFIGL